MERIQSLLNKLQNLASQTGERQIIDIDLMLDYTRVIYADLLEAKSDLMALQSQTRRIHVAAQMEEKVEATDAPSAAVVPDLSLGEHELPESPSEEVPADPVASQMVAASIPEAQELSSAENIQAIAAPEPEAPINLVPEIEDAINESELPPTDQQPQAEEAVIATDVLVTEEDVRAENRIDLSLADEALGTSGPKIVINDEDFGGYIEPSAVDEPEIFSEIHFELPEVKDRAAETAAPEFFFQPQKDIRSFIAINDKYQFMNELFANSRSAYEESLDMISSFPDYATAEQWLTETAAGRYKWSLDDVTFQSLLYTTKRFFSA